MYQITCSLAPKRYRVLRERGHDFILPNVKTDRFKRAFVNRRLFKFISYFFILNPF